MKTSALGLIMFLGCFLGVILTAPIPMLVLSILGGACFGFSVMFFTSIYSGKVWGIKIKGSRHAGAFNFIGIVGGLIGGFCIVSLLKSTFATLFSGRIVETLINLAAFIIPVAISPMIAKKILESALAKSDNAMILGDLEIFKEIDANMAEATHFVVGFEGVALFSSTNYCYAVYLYENYQLGTLTKPEEVALVGTYFVQKYSERYTFKVDVEVIPGTPGQTVVAVGTGGIGVARIQGTPDKRIFRSYIFTKK